MDGGLMHGELTEKVLRAAIEVHRVLGPGLLESAYRECLVEQLCASDLEVEREAPIAIRPYGIVREQLEAMLEEAGVHVAEAPYARDSIAISGGNAARVWRLPSAAAG